MIVAPIRPGFKLEDLGTAEQAIQRFLSTTVAPEGSDKQASLLSASSRWGLEGGLSTLCFWQTTLKTALWQSVAMRRYIMHTAAHAMKELICARAACRRDGQGQLYYTADFTVKSPLFYRHNVSVSARRTGVLYTFNSQCPETRWEQERANLQSAAESFRVVKPNSSIPSSTGIPQRS